MSVDYDKLQYQTVLAYYSSLDCSRSLAACLLYKYEEYEQLVSLEFIASDYNDTVTAQDSLAATCFLAKNKFLVIEGLDKGVKAWVKYEQAESQCAEANRRIKNSRFKNPYTASVLENAKRTIAGVLGGFDPVEFVDACNWGPGSSTLIRRKDASAPRKFDAERQITPRAYNFVKDWFREAYPQWVIPYFEIVSCDKIVTVDKNAKTDRVISITPGINLWFQKGIGSMIRRRLLNHGIDLNDQRHNQRLARLGSKFDNLATLDFSSASDTICYELVKDLLPARWFSILNSFRVDYGQYGKTTVQYEKFSGMGNGFTFELESLIFYALAEAACSQLGLRDATISVFGDDVILPTAASALYTEVSEDCGFTVNRSKSYSSTYFRESCGSYYFKGADIKPIFLKEPLNGTANLLKTANSIRRLAHRRNYYGCDRRLRACWQVVVRGLGSKTPKFSDGYGDDALAVNYCEADSSVQRLSLRYPGYQGYRVKVFALLACQHELNTSGLLMSKLKEAEKFRDFDPYEVAVSDVGSGNSVPMSGQMRYATVSIDIPEWYDFGPWV